MQQNILKIAGVFLALGALAAPAQVKVVKTAGAAVGVLEMPRKRSSRISRGLEQLAADGWVTPFADWRRNPRLHRPPGLFNEAERCARWIVERWYA